MTSPFSGLKNKPSINKVTDTEKEERKLSYKYVTDRLLLLKN
jgi:hypothetical protein